MFIIAFIAFNHPFFKNKILCLKKICQKIIFNKSILIPILLSLRCGGAYESQSKWTLIGTYIVTKLKIKIDIFALKLYIYTQKQKQSQHVVFIYLCIHIHICECLTIIKKKKSLSIWGGGMGWVGRRVHEKS